MPVKDAVSPVEGKDLPSSEKHSDHIPIGEILSWPGAPLLLKQPSNPIR